MDMVTDWLASNLLNIIVILGAGYLVYHLGVRIIHQIVKHAVKGSHRSWHKKDIEKRQLTLLSLFMSLWRVIAIALIGVLLFRQLFPGIDLTPVLASAGIIGIAVGFGAQALIKDFLSGIFIISENQYRVGDVIEVNGASGTVEQIGTRSTILRDDDGNVHYFPNGVIQHVINKTMGYSVARLTFNLNSSTDIDAATKVINATGKKLSEDPKWKRKITTPPCFVGIQEFTADSITVEISGKTMPSDQWSVASEMRRRLIDAFEKEGIKL